MKLDEAVDVWAELAASRDEGPDLPYPSMVAMTLAGVREDAFGVGTLAMLATSAYGADELPLDMAPSRCRAIDSQFYDEYADTHGSRPKGATVMEASWLATDHALYYVAPALGCLRRWPWSGTRIEPGRSGRNKAKFKIVTEQGSWKLSTAARAFPNLLTCASWAKARH